MATEQGHANFKPAWWLKNRHLQTIWSRVARRKLRYPLTHERMELPDGDFLDVMWAGENHYNPIVIILHGLGGSIRSPYAIGLINTIVEQGWRAAFMYFRGAGDEPNRLTRGYHSGDTQDFDFLIHQIRQREPGIPLFVAGFSLGGNVLLKWLGEHKEQAMIKGAVAISPPFDLTSAANRLQEGFSRFYQWYLLTNLKLKYRKKFKTREHRPVDFKSLRSYRNFWQFDDALTAPLHGFTDVHDYYRRCSSKQFLKDIRIPTLLIHAQDDPFMTDDIIPESHQVSGHVELDITPQGGHVGFVAGQIPGKAEYWLDHRIIQFFVRHL